MRGFQREGKKKKKSEECGLRSAVQRGTLVFLS